MHRLTVAAVAAALAFVVPAGAHAAVAGWTDAHPIGVRRAVEIDLRFEARFYGEPARDLTVRCRRNEFYTACTYVDRGLCHRNLSLRYRGMRFNLGTTWIGHDRVYRDRTGVHIWSAEFLDQGPAC